jgi:hypothetical protein
MHQVKAGIISIAKYYFGRRKALPPMSPIPLQLRTRTCDVGLVAPPMPVNCIRYARKCDKYGNVPSE